MVCDDGSMYAMAVYDDLLRRSQIKRPLAVCWSIFFVAETNRKYFYMIKQSQGNAA